MRAAPSWILLCVGLTFALALPAQAERAIRYLLFMTGPNEGFSPHRPERITPEAFRELMGNFEGLPPSHVEVGLSMIISYLHHPEAKTMAALRRFLDAAEATNTPITVKWLFLHPIDKEAWKAAFKNTLTHRNCRYLTFYNWNRIETAERGQEIIEAVRELVAEYTFDSVDERSRQ